MICCGFVEGGVLKLIATSDAVCKLLRLPIPLYLQTNTYDFLQYTQHYFTLINMRREIFKNII